jgi:hypothetical protein
MMRFCQVFWLSCLNRNDEVLPGILADEVLPGILTNEVLPGIFTIMFIQKWWNSENTWQNFIISV